MPKTLYWVIPCYNEEEALPQTAETLIQQTEEMIAQQKISPDSRILFVDDGSADKTWELICRFHQMNRLCSGLQLSRNRGHQNALLAGLFYAAEKADFTVSMDADMQDDPAAVWAMIDAYSAGSDIVYGVRSQRKSDRFFKRFSAEAFYRILNFLGAETVFNHADFRLMSRRDVEGLQRFREVNLFLRGIVPMIGYPSSVVYYERRQRTAGKSKYPFRKMLHFALDGITSFSTKPIRLISFLGFLIFLVSILAIVYSLIRHLTGHSVAGWTSVLASVWAIGGLILLSIGVIGEYIGKIYLETKARPRYLIQEILDQTADENKSQDKK